MMRSPDGQVVAEAEEKSRLMVQSYLLNEGSSIHAPQPSLIDMSDRLRKQQKKAKRERRRREGKEPKMQRRGSCAAGTTTSSFPSKSKSKRRGSSVGNIKSDSSVSTTAASDSACGEDDVVRDAGSPVTMILDGLRKVTPPGKSPRTFCSLQMYGDFEEWTYEQKKGYDKDAIAAIRSQDIDTLRKWKEEGRVLQAANAFGESLLHMACRRGFLSVVKFLVDEAGHNLWIRDDTGRTPLHDACWTAVPEPELVKFIIDKVPDMLLVTDKRGHTPLDYARKDHWQTWLDFFACIDFKQLLPERDCFYVDIAQPNIPRDDSEIIVENLDAIFGELAVEEKETRLLASCRRFIDLTISP